MGITRNTAYIFFSQVTIKLCFVIFVAVAARLLGAEGYGDFILVTTMALVATTFANFGIRPMIVRIISREKERAEEFLSNVLVVRTILAAIAYGVLLAFVNLAGFRPEIGVLVAIGGTAVLNNTIRDSLEAVLVAYQRMRLLGAFSVATAAAQTIVGLTILWLDLGLPLFFAANVAVDAAFTVGMGVVVRRRLVRFRPRFEIGVVKALLLGCLPFLAAFLLGFMDTKVDILMLSLIKGPLEPNLAIGYYGPAHTVLMTIMLLPRSLNQVLVPVVSRSIYEDPAAVRDVIEKSTKFVMLVVSCPLILATTFFSEPIVGLIFGDQFAPTAKALALLGWAYGFYAVNVPSHSVLGSSKELRYFLPLLLGSFVLNIALDVILIPRYSYLGAAMGTVVVMSAGFVGRFYFLRRILDLRLAAARPYVKLFLALGLTLALGFAIRSFVPWIVLAVVVAVTYAGLLYLLRALDEDEWALVVQLVGKKLKLGRRTG